jgi:hypothetical protein
MLNKYGLGRNVKVSYYPLSFLTQLKSPKAQVRQTPNLLIRLNFVPIAPSLQAQDVNSHTSALGKYCLYVL